MINRVKHLLPRKTLMLLYYTIIYPYLSYCCVVWGGAPSTSIECIRTLQKRAVRLVSQAPYRAPSTPLFKKLNLLKFDDIFTFQTLQFVGKIKLNLLPAACCSLLYVSNPNKRYNTRSQNYFEIPRSRTTLRQNCISVRGAQQWNALPIAIQNSLSIKHLNGQLITYLKSFYS